jgi:transposase-like protein
MPLRDFFTDLISSLFEENFSSLFEWRRNSSKAPHSGKYKGDCPACGGKRRLINKSYRWWVYRCETCSKNWRKSRMKPAQKKKAVPTIEQ